jgi:hypothetical protein
VTVSVAVRVVPPSVAVEVTAVFAATVDVVVVNDALVVPAAIVTVAVRELRPVRVEACDKRVRSRTDRSRHSVDRHVHSERSVRSIVGARSGGKISDVVYPDTITESVLRSKTTAWAPSSPPREELGVLGSKISAAPR